LQRTTSTYTWSSLIYNTKLYQRSMSIVFELDAYSKLLYFPHFFSFCRFLLDFHRSRIDLKYEVSLGLFHTRHFRTQDYDKKIKSFLRLTWFLKSLPWPLDIHGLKISFYRNIFLSQYLFIEILCDKMTRVNKTLL